MNAATATAQPPEQVGRYTIFDRLAAGGMATVYLARLTGSEGFTRVVAAKRMHPHLLGDPEFCRMFVGEARLAARVRHPNVAQILDVLSHQREIIIVMEYVHGVSLTRLLQTALERKQSIPIPVACGIMAGVLQGLHAVHEAKDNRGEPLGLVHRDISLQNVLVGTDGVARVVDFGVAKAVQLQNETQPGTLKGKFSYMAPEIVRGDAVTRQADIFSAATVLWELLATRKLFAGATPQEALLNISSGKYPSPRQFNRAISPALERIVTKGLQPDPKLRHATALEFASELESAVPLASQRVVGEWVTGLAGDTLAERAQLIQEVEAAPVGSLPRSIPRSIPPADEPTVPSGTVSRSVVAGGQGPLARPSLSVALAALALVATGGGFLAWRIIPAPGEQTAHAQQAPEAPASAEVAQAPEASMVAEPAASAPAATPSPSASATLAADSEPGAQPSLVDPALQPTPPRATRPAALPKPRSARRAKRFLPDDF